MVNFSGYIEQGSVQMAQEWVKNVVNPNLVTDSFDKNKLHADLKEHAGIIFLWYRMWIAEKRFSGGRLCKNAGGCSVWRNALLVYERRCVQF